MPTDWMLFREYDAIVAESIVVDGSDILWCDITRGLIRRSTPGDPVDGSEDVVIDLPSAVCSFHLARSGFVVSLPDRVILADSHGHVLRTLATIRHARPQMRLNEGKIDPAGRWVTGSMELTEGAPAGAFYSVTTAGDVAEIIDGIGTANGLEWSPDGALIYFTDTAANTVFVADCDESGRVSNPRHFHRGNPHDGLVRDADGNFWGAVFGEGRVIHLDSAGHELGSVALPAPNLTSLAFSGNTLYIGSAREKLTSRQLAEHPLSGSIFAIETATSGSPARTFDA